MQVFLQAKVTGSTLNGKKEKMQAEEGDKEKWDFLSFAEAWTPNDNVEDLQNEFLFTHVRLKTYVFNCCFILKQSNHFSPTFHVHCRLYYWRITI